jgi:hypothetical protein
MSVNQQDFSDKQIVHHIDQVLTPDKLVLFQHYKIFQGSEDKEGKPIRILNIFPEKGEFRYFSFDRVPIDMKFADTGILPYQNGKWNKINYLIKVNPSK